MFLNPGIIFKNVRAYKRRDIKHFNIIDSSPRNNPERRHNILPLYTSDSDIKNEFFCRIQKLS